jgi:cytochrome c553
MSQISRLVLVLSLLAARVGFAADADFTAEQLSFFETAVRPLLVERCHQCHGAETQEAGLRLDARSAILRGGDTGPAIVPGEPDKSEVIRAVRYDPEGYQMPPDGKLSDEQIAILTRWVDMGAPWPDETDVAAHAGEEFNLQERAQRWAFQPLTRPPVPPVDAAQVSDWCRNPIDRFVLAKLHQNGLTPVPQADRVTLLRRASFDVIGLPPSPREVTDFASDESPDAYDRLIDELLASPHYGERWGRHWLDLVRYAEGRGHEFDYDVANAHQYRDYVIRALNADVPYDRFVVEHVAGDLLVSPEVLQQQLAGLREPGDVETDADRQLGVVAAVQRPGDYPLRTDPLTDANESILGTGFWFLGEWVHSPVDIRADEAERFANMIDVYSKSFLGLTVACARCHDHKFDPITTKDFYALQGYLQSASYRQARFETIEHNRRIARQLDQVRRQATAELARAIGRMTAPVTCRLDDYLLAAAAQLRGEERPHIEDLNRQLLDHWVTYLPQAAATPDDPLHEWALYATGDIRNLHDLLLACEARTRLPSADEEFVAAFAEDAELSTDGGLFLRAAPEETPASCAVVLSDDPARPIASLGGRVIVTPQLNAHSPPDGNDDEPGKMDGWQRGGRVIRTPTFEIQRPRLLCRVRGGCNVRVAVDSHVLVNGPLHGSLLSEHPTPETGREELRWLSLDVSRYIGHRAHVEFVPRRGETFTFVGVLQGERVPEVSPFANLPEVPFPALEDTPTTDAVAAQFAHRLLAWLGTKKLAQGVMSRNLEWMLRHPQLFGLQSPEAVKQLADVARPFIEQQSELLADIRQVSATAPAMLEGSGEDEYVFVRGNWKKRGETVPRRFLEVFDGMQMSRPQRGSGRLELAAWMVDPAKTPILPRVIVNRIWQHYFGVGIVPTPDDFGYMGQDPSHPELLDWLASELVEHNWSLKHIHRLILTSAAYRMSSAVDGGSLMVDRRDSTIESINHQRLTINPAEADPTNRLLSRQNVKRLEGEAIRDALLAISGRLDEQMYGRSIPVHLTPFMEGRGRPAESGPLDGAGRRSIYIAVRRNFPDPLFQAFDMPNPHTTVGRRNVSNVPAQALAMMNNPFVIQQAQWWGRRLAEARPSADRRELIREAYLVCVAREPNEIELHAATTFLESQAAELQMEIEDPRVWGDLCHVLLNSKEFLFVR